MDDSQASLNTAKAELKVAEEGLALAVEGPRIEDIEEAIATLKADEAELALAQEILIGKSIPGILIGLVEGTFILLVVIYWFEVPLRGSLAALYLGMFLLSAVGIGLMISSLAVTQQQGILGAFLFLVPAVILSGFATPISNMPEIVQQLTYINPIRYFLVILRGVFLEGDSWSLLFDQYWPMVIIAVVTLALAGWLFRHIGAQRFNDGSGEYS